MTVPPDPTGALTLGHVLDAAGLALHDVAVLRHTYNRDGIPSADDATPEAVLAYTRTQGVANKMGVAPPATWLIFMADGQRRSRFRIAYENGGELLAERTSTERAFDLSPSPLLHQLAGRLVIEWSRDAVNWMKTGSQAAAFPVVEIADPVNVPFPGFDEVLLTFAGLQAVAGDSRYSGWRSALGAVKGIYLIADTSSGQLYVGKADGHERLLGRWMSYAQDGHGGNVALRGLAGLDPSHRRHFTFSILRVFGPSATSTEIDQAESHYKRALLTRQFGLNRN